MRLHRPTLAVLVAFGLLGVLAIGWGLRTDDERVRRGSAVVLEDLGSHQVVSVLDGPDPGRHLVDWAGEVPAGQPFTVALGGDCGCEPRPAALVRRSGPAWPVVLFGVVLLTLQGVQVALSARLVRAGRAAQRRARAVVGTGPADGGPPLGRVALARVDRRFDPTVPFRAWGGPDPGDVALTSVDGRQLVLPTSRIGDPTTKPFVDGTVTAAASWLLGWPPAGRPPGDASRVARVDAAVDTFRSWTRVASPVAAVIGVATVAVAIPLFADGRPPEALALTLVGMVVAIVVNRRRPGLAPLLDEAVGKDQKARLKLAAALAQARWPTPPEDGAAHGPGGPADGARWMPPPRPR